MQRLLLLYPSLPSLPKIFTEKLLYRRYHLRIMSCSFLKQSAWAYSTITINGQRKVKTSGTIHLSRKINNQIVNNKRKRLHPTGSKYMWGAPWRMHRIWPHRNRGNRMSKDLVEDNRDSLKVGQVLLLCFYLRCMNGKGLSIILGQN